MLAAIALATLACVLAMPGSALAGDPWTLNGGNLNMGAVDVTQTATAVLGTTPHVAFIEGGDVYVKRWTGAAWVQDGAARLNTNAGTAITVEAVADGTNVYVAWHEDTGGFDNLYVKRWNGANWAALGGSLNVSAAASGTNPALAVVNGTLTAAWIEDTANNDVFVKQWSGAAWNAVGGAVEPTTAQWVNGVAVTGNAANLYVLVGNYDGTNYEMYARRWTGAAWATVGPGSLNNSPTGWANHVEAGMSGANLWVVFQEDWRLYGRQWNGAAWTSLTGAGISPDNSNLPQWDFDMVVGGTGPIVAMRKLRTPTTVEVVGWTGTDWKRYGGTLNRDKRDVMQPSIGLVSGVPWVAFPEDDSTGVAQLQSVRWNPTTTMVGNLTNFVATPTSGQIAFSWTNPPDATYSGVEIYRSTTEGVRGTLVQTVASPGTSWTDTGRVNGVRLYYTFITYNTLGDRRETAYETADSNIIVPRYAGAFESDGTNAYLFGGVDQTSTSHAEIFRFNQTSTATSPMTSVLPAVQSDQRAVWVGGAVNRIVLLGGHTTTATNTIMRYDPGADLLVTSTATLPAPRTSGAAAYSPATGRIYYLGGTSTRWMAGTVYDSIYWYDPATDTSGNTGAVLPQPMFRMTASYWPLDGCIYMFGGKTTGDVDSNRIVKYCPSTNTASNLPVNMPVAMSEIAVSRGTRGIALLGASAVGYQQPVYEFDPFERAFLQHPVRLPFTQVTNATSIATDDIAFATASYGLSTKVTQVNMGVYVDATPSTPPNTPTNVAPASGAVVATATPTLSASAFSDPNGGDTHLASHWQLRTYGGTYTNAAFDSGLDFTNKTSIVTTALAEGRHCFRVRYRDQNRVWSPFSAETCFWVDATAQNPLAATTLEQHRANGTTVIPSGGYTTDGIGTNIVLKFDMADPDGSQTLTPWVEVRAGATAFSVACGTSLANVTFSGAAIAPTQPDEVVTATVNVTGLVAGTTYRWRACARDATGRSGAWTSKGATPDFRVVVDQLPTATHSLPAAGSTWTDTTPTFVATFTDPDAPDTGTIDVEVCTVNPTPAQTCTGAGGTLASSGATASGIANGATGSWTSPVLGLATYWWRVRARDQYDLEGSWSTGRQLTIGNPSMTVGVDQTALTIPPMVAGSNTTGTTLVTVTTSSASGYTLTSTDASDTGGATCTVGTCAGSWIPDWTGTNATPTTWATGTTGANGYVGLTVLAVTGQTTTKLGKWGTGTTATDFVNNKYAGLRTTATTLHATTGYNSGSDTVLAAYRAIAAPSGTTAGSYSAAIAYAAVANP